MSASSDAKARVVVEREDLLDKISRLQEFNKTDLFESFSDEIQSLLTEQEQIMYKYSEILGKRLDLWVE